MEINAYDLNLKEILNNRVNRVKSEKYYKRFYIKGVPVTITISEVYLEKCLNDPEKMKELEETLKKIPGWVENQIRYTRTMIGNPVMTYANYSFDENGKLSYTSGCTNNTAGKLAKESARKRALEKELLKERLKKKRLKRKLEQKRLAQKREEKKFKTERLLKQSAARSASEKARIAGTHIMMSKVKAFDVKA